MKIFIGFLLLLLCLSCRKQPVAADPLVYTKKMEGIYKWQGTLYNNNPFTYHDTTLPYSFTGYIKVLDNKTITLADTASTKADTLHYILTSNNTLVYIHADTFYKTTSYIYSYDTLWFNYANNLKTFSAFYYDKGYIQYLKLQAQ